MLFVYNLLTFPQPGHNYVGILYTSEMRCAPKDTASAQLKGGSCMKKPICIILTVALLVGNIGVCSVVAADIKSDASLKEFTADFTEMVNDYEESSCDFNNLGSAQLEEYATSGTAENHNTDNISTTNRLIVKSEKEVESLDAVGHVCGYNDLHILQFDNSESFNEAVEYYLDLPYVEYVEEDLYCSSDEETIEATTDVSTETETEVTAFNPTQTHSDLFGFTALNEYLEENPLNYSDTLEIAVVDSGVQNDHDYLKDKVVPTGFDSVNGVSCYDDRGHGTHVAGIIAANTPENVKIKPYKVLDSAGRGTITQVYLGVLAAVEDGVDIINMSLSIRGDNETLHEAVRTAYNAGIIVVASAGNKGVNLENVPYSPACYDEVLTVTACTDSKKIADFSNYGVNCDASAPGVNINSTYLNNTYKTMSGTSMSAPFISAAMSYIMMSFTDMTVSGYYTELRKNTKPGDDLKNGRYIVADYLTQEKSTSVVVNASYTKSTFSENFELTLTSNIENSKIYYNTTAMEADSYVIYNSPIPVNYDLTVKYFAIAPDGAQSSTTTRTYTRTAQSASLFTVDDDGTLIGYNGDDIDIVVPTRVSSKYVKAISPEAFKGNTAIRSVMVMPNVTTISDEAFKGCTSLEYVRGKGVTSIGNNAFDGCTSLNLLSGSKVQSVGNYAFYGCNNLKTFDFTSVQTVGASAFENVGNISGFSANSILTVGDKAFYKTSITNVSLTLATQIGSYAFAECADIEVVNLPRAAEVGEYAFADCPKLSEIYADAITSVGDTIFKNCGEIVALSLNSVPSFGDADNFKNNLNLEYFSADSITSVADEMFLGCENLTEISFDSAKTIGEKSFYGTAVSDVSLPAAEVIGSYAFAENPYLTTVVADNLLSIGDNCFYKSNITNADFEKVTSVGNYGFAECRKLTNLNLPAVTAAGESAFIDCNALKTVTLGGLVKVDYKQIEGSIANLTSFSANSANEFINIGAAVTAPLFPKLVTFSADALLSLPSVILSNCTTLQDVSLSALIEIEDDAFENCSLLSSLSLPALVAMGDTPFDGCSGLKAFSADVIESFELGLLEDSTSIEAIELNGAKAISVGSAVTDGYIKDNFTSLTTFKANALTEIPECMFKGSESVTTLSFNSITGGAAGEFKDCINLTSFSATALKEMPDEFFRNCTSIGILKLENLLSIGKYAFADSDLGNTSVSYFKSLAFIDDYAFMNTGITSFTSSTVTELGEGVFENATDIVSFSLNALTSIDSKSIDADGLSEFNLLEGFTANALTEIPAELFKNTNIKTACFKAAEVIGESAFRNCYNLNKCDFPSVKVIKDYALYGCSQLSNLNVSKLEELGSFALYGVELEAYQVFRYLHTIKPDAFDNCYIYESIFYSPVELGDLPDGYLTIVGSTVETVDKDLYTSARVYAMKGNPVERVAKNNGVSFTEFCSDNPIVVSADFPEYITGNYAAYYLVRGFDLSYKWYASTNSDGSDATYIGASTDLTIAPSNVKKPYVYCIATSTENGNTVTFKSPVIKLPKYALSVKNAEDTYISGSFIKTYCTDIASLGDIVNIADGFENTQYASNTGNGYTYFGTGSQIKMKVDENSVLPFTLVVYGDINGDGFVDVLDAACCERISTLDAMGDELTDAEFYAANISEDSIINTEDFQYIVNMALSS